MPVTPRKLGRLTPKEKSAARTNASKRLILSPARRRALKLERGLSPRRQAKRRAAQAVAGAKASDGWSLRRVEEEAPSDAAGAVEQADAPRASAATVAEERSRARAADAGNPPASRTISRETLQARAAMGKAVAARLGPSLDSGMSSLDFAAWWQEADGKVRQALERCYRDAEAMGICVADLRAFADGADFVEDCFQPILHRLPPCAAALKATLETPDEDRCWTALHSEWAQRLVTAHDRSQAHANLLQLQRPFGEGAMVYRTRFENACRLAGVEAAGDMAVIVYAHGLRAVPELQHAVLEARPRTIADATEALKGALMQRPPESRPAIAVRSPRPPRRGAKELAPMAPAPDRASTQYRGTRPPRQAWPSANAAPLGDRRQQHVEHDRLAALQPHERSAEQKFKLRQLRRDLHLCSFCGASDHFRDACSNRASGNGRR